MKNRFHSRSAIGKLKAILVIDVLIVAVAAGVYFYLQAEGLIIAGPKPAEFVVTDFVIDPVEAEVFEPVAITVNLTNVGDEPGNYMGNLTINNVLEDNQTVLLEGGESTIMEFAVVKKIEGTYTAEVGGLSGSFDIVAPSPTSSNIKLEKIILPPYEGWANPFESWVNETISVSATATNIGGEAESLSLRLMIDDSLVDVKRVELSAGETTTVEFTFNSTIEGKHSVKVNNLSGSFLIVPTGYHTLIVARTGGGSDALPFTINGVAYKATASELLPVGDHNLVVPNPFTTETAVFEFDSWNDGVTTPSRTINLQSRTFVTVTYDLISGYASCPSLLFWNGTKYVYVSEVSSRGYLGYINYINEEGWPVFWRNYPRDYIKLTDTGQLQPRNGYYDLILTENSDEIFYLDMAYMLVVDHPSNVDVYSTMGEQYIDPNFMGKIYTISKNPLTPISAFNEKGENVLSQIAKLDGIFTNATNGIYSQSFSDITWNTLTLELGDLSNAEQIKLVVNGILDWGPDEDQGNWYGSFFTQQVPNGTQPTPPPYMEVRDASGSWVRVPDSRQFPLLPDTVTRTFVVDLTDLFPTDDYSIRINNFWNVTFDYIGIDTTPQESLTIQRIDPAYSGLEQAFYINSNSSGDFTRYGNVTQLVLAADAKFVIGRQGDRVSLQFPIANLASPGEGLERDFFLISFLWFKESGNPAVEFTVDPLPFQGMSGYPYTSAENYPSDEGYSSYLLEYNTRALPLLHAQLTIDHVLIGIIGTGLAIAGILVILIWRRACADRQLTST